jgi:hypothetical protein
MSSNRLWIALVVALAQGCGAPPAVRVTPPPPPERLAEVATTAVEDELRSLGFRVEPHPASERPTIVASRASVRWTFALAVESLSDERGPKWVLRLTVFHEPGRELKGEIAPSAIVPGVALDANARRDLVRALGKRAVQQFTENF